MLDIHQNTFNNETVQQENSHTLEALESTRNIYGRHNQGQHLTRAAL
jgi:hypothetical protein